MTNPLRTLDEMRLAIQELEQDNKTLTEQVSKLNERCEALDTALFNLANRTAPLRELFESWANYGPTTDI